MVFDIAAQMREALLFDGMTEFAVLGMLGEVDPAPSTWLDAAPDGKVLLTKDVADALSSARREKLARCADDNGMLFGLFPFSREDELARLHYCGPGWDPPLNRYVVRLPPDDEAPSPQRKDRYRLETLIREAGLHHVIAPAQTGKSHVARRLAQLASERGIEYVHLISLEEGAQADYRPTWWGKWLRDRDAHALWLVDAADEAVWANRSLDEVLSAYGHLDHGPRERLSVLVFQRDDESISRAGRIIQDAKHFQLLPIDDRERERIVRAAGGDSLATVDERIGRLGVLALRDYPRVLRALSANDVDDLRGLWERVLTELVARPRDGESPVPASVLDAGSRIAAVLLLSGRDVVREEHRRDAITWSDVLPEERLSRGGHGLRRTAVMMATADGHRFRERHVEELLAARALETVFPPVLRELITEGDGQLRGDLRGTLEYISQMTADQGLRRSLEKWAVYEPRVLPPEDGLALLDELCRHASGARVDGRVHLLRHQRVAERALERFADPTENEAVKDLMLQLARENDWSERFLDHAMAVALRPEEPPGLRVHAMYFVRLFDPAGIADRMQPILEEPVAGNEALHALVLEALIGKEPVMWIASRAPAPEPHLYDARAALLDRLAEALDVDAAFEILADLRRSASDKILDLNVCNELVVPALRRLIAEPEWTKAIVEALERFGDTFHHWPAGGDAAADLRATLKERPSVRRWLYGSKPLGWHVWPELDLSADRDWLMSLAQSGNQDAMTDLFRLSRDGDGPDAVLARKYLAEHHEEAIELLERSSGERALKTARAAQQDAETFTPLADAVREVLDAAAPAERALHLLSALCFRTPRSFRNVAGRFEGLTDATQQEILDRIGRALGQAEPTRLPTGHGPFSSSIVDEASAFSAFLYWEGTASLTETMVHRWLPSVLFAGAKERAQVTARCYDLWPAATIGVVIEAIRQDASRQDRAHTARDVPAALWSERELRESAWALVENDKTPDAYASDLIRVIVAGTVSEGTRVGTITRCRPLTEVNTMRGRAAYDALLTMAPAWALERLEQADITSSQAVEALQCLYSDWSVLTADWRTWDDDTLLRLARILFRLDLRDDRVMEAHFVGDDERLVRLRDAVVGLLARERANVRIETIEDLRPGDHELGEWAQRLRHNSAFERALAEYASAEGRRIDPRRAVDALSEKNPLIKPGSIDDAFHALDWLLSEEIAPTAAQHTSFFRKTSSAAQAKGLRPRETWVEGALQAYLDQRLQDLLRQTEGLVVSREPKGQFGEMPDFVVRYEANEIPIEVKWSHDDPVGNLRQQLAQRYLLDRGNTHGLFVVGLTGDTGEASLGKHLEEARDAVVADHPQLRIAIVLVPVARAH